MHWFGVKRTVKLGVKSLWMHRLRSVLTTMGIVFGVCSVVAMLAIGEGASRETQKAIAVDAKKPYSEMLIGRFTPKKHTWNAKYRSDWIIAIGDFASSDTQQNP